MDEFADLSPELHEFATCLAVIDGHRCQRRARLVRLCLTHFDQQSVLNRKGDSLEFAIPPYRDQILRMRERVR